MIKLLLSFNNPNGYYKAAIDACGAEYTFDENEEYQGLILTGGRDIDPNLFGEEINGAEIIDYERDKKEFSLLKNAIDKNIPVFGICRGIQVLNVYFGGTLHQDIDSPIHRDPEKKNYIFHKAICTGDNMISEIYGKEFIVSSWHHQAVKELAPDMFITHISDDGIIEGIEHKKLPVFGVQWHPERCVGLENGACNGLDIFNKFIQICKEH